jgi:Flp pilus assembly protein TadD
MGIFSLSMLYVLPAWPTMPCAADTILVGDFSCTGAEKAVAAALPYFVSRILNARAGWEAFQPTGSVQRFLRTYYNAKGEPDIAAVRLLAKRMGADRFLLGNMQSPEQNKITLTLVSGSPNRASLQRFQMSASGKNALMDLAGMAASALTDRPPATLSGMPVASLPEFSELLRLYRNGKLKQALRKAYGLHEKIPDSADICYILGRIESDRKNYYKALHYFVKANNLAPRFAQPAYGEGKVWLALNRPSLAEKAFERATAVQPAFFEAYRELGIIKAQHGDCNGALAALRQAEKLRPRDNDVRYWIAYTLNENGKREEALRILTNIIDAQPSNADAHLLIGKIYCHNGDFGRAIPYLRSATRLRPDDARAYSLLGEALSRVSGHTDREAIRAFKKALELSGTSPTQPQRP